VADYLAAYVPVDGTVLEIGAGYADWINQTRAARKYAVDLWPGLPQHVSYDVQSIVHDLSTGLPAFDTVSFDVVMASNVLEHFEADIVARLVTEVYTCLRPNGRFIVIQPNFRYAYRHYFDDYTHRSIFTDVSLPNLMRSHGFRIEKLQARFMPYSMRGSSLPIRTWMVRAYLHLPVKPFAGQMLVIGKKSE
jgi:cyclopropane fatty-acyl-phospholipid synthase-like methyltransferase